MAGTDNITNDYIEVPSRALRSNVVKLFEMEQRKRAIDEQKFDLELRALTVISELDKKILFLSACTGGISIYLNLTTKIPSATAFAISILLMCLFLAVSSIHIRMAKSRIKTLNLVIKILIERYEIVKVDARILMELEENRKGRLATNVADNSEGPDMDMESFIARAKTIYDDDKDFSDFEKVYRKLINLSWAIGVINIPVVLVMSFFNYYYGQGSSSPDKLSFDV